MDFEEYRILLSRVNYIRDRYLENDEIYDGRVFEMILKIKNDLEASYPDHYAQFNNWR